MTPDDLERTAEMLLHVAHVNAGEPTKPEALVRKLLGPASVFSVKAHSLPRDGTFALVNGAPKIYLRKGLPPVRRRWALCQELAEWWLWREGLRNERTLADVERIAAGLLIPRAAFSQALARVGGESRRMAQHFGTSETCLVLRMSELTRVPLALVSPQKVRLRGAEFGWPSEQQMRTLSHTLRLPGIRKVRLQDDRRRLALWGELIQYNRWGCNYYG